jgi:single-strand DNA-binding protein
MGNVNKVILVGNLGAAPELKQTTGNRPYCHLRLATSQVFKDKAGQRQEKTDWHRVTVWGTSADHCVRFLSRGRPVYVEGRLEQRQWQDKDGQKRYATDVVATRVVFLSGQGSAHADGSDRADGDSVDGDSVNAMQEDALAVDPRQLLAVG